MRSALRQSLPQIFVVPALIALASAVGLVGALVGDGVWDVASSLCLAIPAVIFCACVVWKKFGKSGKNS
jgi:xanthosine utilization system XapX-like protein